jgi:hypothetical protein
MRNLAIIGLSVAAAAAAAFGYGSYVERIPNGTVFGCNTCHNQEEFLADFKAAGNKWSRALAAKDSDGDRASNGVELQDPEGKWTVGKADPKIPGWQTYNPDNKGSVPPYAPVEPTSMGRVKALFK